MLHIYIYIYDISRLRVKISAKWWKNPQSSTVDIRSHIVRQYEKFKSLFIETVEVHYSYNSRVYWVLREIHLFEINTQNCPVLQFILKALIFPVLSPQNLRTLSSVSDSNYFPVTTRIKIGFTRH